ncbi:polymer-forming cytoskeletal protein [Saccharicrinis sp. FJH54]|uniref:bactofilin family protein n=1 Tax=Saccharicrinis sp. FJH54 TaxID=3344665 RepID=UPI0035D4D4B5
MAKTNSIEETKHNLITSGTRIKGDLSAEGDLRIDGNVEGTINCKGKLVVGPEGTLKGEISCKTAEVMGAIEGQLLVNELLSIKATAKINGDIKTSRLAIEPNAVFTGTCDMGKPVASNTTVKEQNDKKK